MFLAEKINSWVEYHFFLNDLHAPTQMFSFRLIKPLLMQSYKSTERHTTHYVLYSLGCTLFLQALTTRVFPGFSKWSGTGLTKNKAAGVCRKSQYLIRK